MKSLTHILTAAGCALFAIAPATPALSERSTPTATNSTQQLAQFQDVRPRITVLTLSHGDVSNDYWWWRSYYRGEGAARGISELLVTELVAEGSYSLLNNSQIEMASGRRVDEGTAMERAREMDLDAVVTGTITQFDLRENQQCVSIPFVGRTCTDETNATVQLNVRLVDPVSGTILATASGQGEATAGGGSISLRRGPSGSSSQNQAVDELLTEATEKAIEQIVPEIASAQDRF
ncbi:MAG: LPS assembly lipoprotein LptE [Cyanobacteria bacterium P01_A01_bin.17]